MSYMVVCFFLYEQNQEKDSPQDLWPGRVTPAQEIDGNKFQGKYRTWSVCGKMGTSFVIGYDPDANMLVCEAPRDSEILK